MSAPCKADEWVFYRIFAKKKWWPGFLTDHSQGQAKAHLGFLKVYTSSTHIRRRSFVQGSPHPGLIVLCPCRMSCCGN